VLGRVEEIATAPDGASLATIAYPVATTAHDAAQLLNIVFGLSSLQADVSVVDFEAPVSLLDALGGPRFGVLGLREITGVADRALTCSAVKPMGMSPKALADLLRGFARAGIDIVKDDQGLADHGFCRFEERLRACLDAADEVANETGRRTLYVPNLIGPPTQVFDQLRRAEDAGARAVMVSPLLLGLPTFWELCQRRASVPVFAHPSLGGALRCAPEMLFGKLLRLYGADAVIFVGYAGRFGTPRETCAAIASNLRRRWGALAPSLPVAGGGVALENAAEAVAFYGRDTALLVGRSLQIDPGRLVERSRALVDSVRDASAAEAGAR
jgi:ribulose-bisphosphate carboxylase large chain